MNDGTSLRTAGWQHKNMETALDGAERHDFVLLQNEKGELCAVLALVLNFTHAKKKKKMIFFFKLFFVCVA
jgi:hypothetical protein